MLRTAEMLKRDNALRRKARALSCPGIATAGDHPTGVFPNAWSAM